MKKVQVLAISGSLRRDSYNRKALQIAKTIAIKTGATVIELDLKELNLPIYDQDVEDEKFPESAKKLKLAVENADVLIFASPEYNSSVSGALKNAIDWISRNGNSLERKVAVIFGASTGRFGTVLGQKHLREILERRSVYILPNPRVFISDAENAFKPDGSFKDEATAEKLKELIEKTLEYFRRLSN